MPPWPGNPGKPGDRLLIILKTQGFPQILLEICQEGFSRVTGWQLWAFCGREANQIDELWKEADEKLIMEMSPGSGATNGLNTRQEIHVEPHTSGMFFIQEPTLISSPSPWLHMTYDAL